MGAKVERRIEYEPLYSQARFHDSASRFKGFSGPVGSGKSMSLVQEAIRLSVINAGLLGLIGAPTYPMLRDVTQRAIFEELENNSIPFEFRKQENLLTLTDTGSEVIFRSLDKPDRLRGTNLAWYGIDELTYCHEEAWLRLQARLRHPLATELCGFGVWTPNGFDWVYRRFIGPEKLLGYDAILAQPYENRHLPQDFYATLTNSYDAKFADQEVLGKYLSMNSGKVYHAFDRTVHLTPVSYDARRQLCWSLDFNVNPMCSVIAQIDGNSVYVIDEMVLPNSNTQKACDEFWQRIQPWLPSAKERRTEPVSLRVYGDSSGGSNHTAGQSDYAIIRQFFRRMPELSVTYHVPAANPPVRDRVNAMNAKLKNAAGFIGMLIQPSCKELATDLEEVIWMADSRGNMTGDIDKRNKKRTHVSDAIGYLAAQEFPIKDKAELFPIQSVGHVQVDSEVPFERKSGWRS